MGNYDGWSAVSKDQLVVWSGVNKAYLLTVTGYCPDLEFASRIAVTSTGHCHPYVVEAIREQFPQVTAVATTEELVASEIDVYAPCAMGGAISDEVLEVLRATIICGAANNQLAHPGIEKQIEERGLLYAPDYCVNSGGVIQVADELEGFDFDRAKMRATSIYDTTLGVLEHAKAEGISPSLAADRMAEQRMRDVGRLRQVYLP
jgi:valine dehydrogenase (NAD+)